MFRKFALVSLDDRDKIIDRFNLDLVTAPKGLGFSVEISTIVTDIREIPTHIKQKLKPITMDINYCQGREYVKANALRGWIEKNLAKRMALEWTTPIGRVYADCKIEEYAFSEIDNQKKLSIPLTIKPLSPFYEIISEVITIYPSSTGKEYPYNYPYTYGIGMIMNNEIENKYIKPIPLIITLYGEMLNVGVGISQKGQGEAYGEVSFEGFSLSSGQWVTINAVTQKISYFNGIAEVDGYNYLNMTGDSYIFAKENATSILTATVASDKSGYLEASYRRYRL